MTSSRGFKDALKGLAICKDVQHRVVWEVYGNYYRNKTVSKDDMNGQSVMQKMFRVRLPGRVIARRN